MRTIYVTLLNIILLISLFSADIFSQENKYIINGKIVDASNYNPVEFANIGIEGTFLGTASDIDGIFKLVIDEKFSDFDVVISAVGYQSKKSKVKELAVDGIQTIKLTPAIYGLSQVDIKAQSRVLYGIIKSAGNLITQNYFSEPFEYKTFYLNENRTNESKTEAVISVVDSNGYGNRTYTDAFINRSYHIDEIRRNYDHQPIEEGLSSLDFLLLFDIVRVRGNILDSTGLYDFDLKLEDITFFNGDSVWAIGYKNSKPAFTTTANNYVTSYSGVIYVSKSTSAVLRNELNIETDGYFPYGYTAFYDDEIKSQSIAKSNYKVVTSYRKNSEGKYKLSSISIEKKLVGNDGKELVLNEKLKILKMKSDNISQVNRREYYSLKSVNKEFWKRFTIPED